MYDHVADQWKKPDTSYKSPQQQRLIQWRKDENFIRVDKPLRIDRARSLGYKAKPGYVVARARVRRGSLRKPTIRAGRKPSAKGITKITGNIISDDSYLDYMPVPGGWAWDDMGNYYAAIIGLK